MEVNQEVLQAWEVAVEDLHHSYSPYSKFRVGSSLIDKSGKVFFGCNIENASYGATICAERVAFLKAVSEGVTEFKAIVVITDTIRPTPPCALCLQVMAEFCDPNFEIYLGNLSKIVESHSFHELLSHPFGPSYLLD
jgi:cytidine deaminase